jgi:hypothetical protein
MRYSILALVLTATACAPSNADQLMDTVEARVRMPPGTGSLATYRRYYYRDGSVIIGTYMKSDHPGREWRSKDKMMLVFDGGCAIVNVTFSITQERVLYIGCNGEA